MDDGPPYLAFFILIGLILLNGFFSMSEMAIVSSRKARLKTKADQGKRGFRKALKAAENPSRYLSTIQIGITLIGILSGAFGGTTFAEPLARILQRIPIISEHAQSLALGFVVVSITLLSIVLGELTPKQLALSNPESFAAFSVPFLEGISFVFHPLVSFLSRTTSALLRLFGVKENPDHVITEEEIRSVLIEGERHGVVAKKERSMVEGVFYLGDRPVENFMTHRSDLVWIDLEDDPKTILKKTVAAGRQSTLPVTRNGLDDVVGVVHSKELMGAFLEGPWTVLKPFIHKATFVPGTMAALKVFEIFKREATDTILIMDEYGGLAGALSLADLVEEIVGELSTPDRDSEDIIKRDDGSYLMGGLVNIDEFAELFLMEKAIPEHREYHTLAGLILEILGTIPRTGEKFSWEGFLFEIMDMDGNRIDKVLIYPPKAAASDSSGDGEPSI